MSTNSTIPASLRYITIQPELGQGSFPFFSLPQYPLPSYTYCMDNRIYPHSTDSHTHILEMKKKGIDVVELLRDVFSNGIEYIMDASVDEKNFSERLKFKQQFPGVFLSAGIHPNEVKTIQEQIERITEQIETGMVSAIGETGLDFHWDTVPTEKQKEMFRAHIELSKSFKLPLIIHNRLADKEILEILQSEDATNGVIHCFSSNYHFARKFVDQGFYISFAGNVTYKKADEIREAARQVPLDRILVETDAPYLAPQKTRGKLNHPGYIGYTIDCIADIFNMGADETAQLTSDNFLRLFAPKEVDK
ncbi:MAG: TatD family deoxyribonuclease [Calditrichaeota bacterium]|nr:MAG: TatD family deoxyribonuclease [Calditrichota bacterium]